MVTSMANDLLGKPSVLAIFAVISLVLGPLAHAVSRRRGWRTGFAVTAAVGLALAIAVTQGRHPVELTGLNFTECTLTSSGSGPSETLLNLIMLMPTAFFAVLATRRMLGPTLLCLATSGLTELTQAVFNTGGCTGQDVLTNSTGAALAACAGWLLLNLARRKRIRPSPPAT